MKPEKDVYQTSEKLLEELLRPLFDIIKMQEKINAFGRVDDFSGKPQK